MVSQWPLVVLDVYPALVAPAIGAVGATELHGQNGMSSSLPVRAGGFSCWAFLRTAALNFSPP